MANQVPNETLNSVLNALPTYYISLVDNASFVAFAETDTAAQINGSNGWKEFTAYSNATRPLLTRTTATAESWANVSPIVFTIPAAAVIHGFFIVTTATKGGTTGLIGGENAFSNGNQIIPSGGGTLTVNPITGTAASS